MALDQATRFLSLKIDGVAENDLVLTSFSGHEELSRLFTFQLEMISDNNAFEAKQVVGKNVTFSVTLADDSPRHFNGFISRFSAGDEDENGRRNYTAEVVSWLWFLTQTADCRIFQNKTVPKIIEQIFDDLGFSDFETGEIKGDHKEWEYCVQYRETDFNFVSRLMEQEGIFYFFKHEDGKHTLVLADQSAACKDCQESEVIYPRDAGTRALEDHITDWQHRYGFHSGKWAQTDYNFKTPSTSLMSQTSTKTSLNNIKTYEIYDYPGEYIDKGVGDTEIKLRIEEEEVEHDVVEAASICKTFTHGGKFKIKEHRSSSEQGKKFVITSIHHIATESTAFESGVGVGGPEYSNSFTAIPDSVTFRPARVTPKPLVSGVQTAVVVGPSGEEIYCDEYGRVKVQFHWDREGEKDENSSCWMRVSHNIAGKQWGFVVLPRMGQEVVVDFEEGDPDRPLVVGMVYNAEQMPPYDLPDNKTQSGFKSRSSKGAGPDNFNEIRFEDLKGEEQVFIHAEKNQDIEVENDETHWVGRDRKKNIDRDEDTEVKRNRTESVGDNEKISIGKNRTETVGKDETISVSGNRTESVDKDERITIKQSRTTDVQKNETVSVGGNRQEAVKKDETVEITGKRELQVGKDNQIQVGKNFALIAGDQIQLQTGAASIIMKKNGDIEIKGKNIKINGSGKINVTASGKVAVKGSKIDNN